MSSIKRVAILGAGRIAEIHLHRYNLLEEKVEALESMEIALSLSLNSISDKRKSNPLNSVVSASTILEYVWIGPRFV